MLQASCQLREAADASEVPNVAIHIAASPDRFGLRGRLAVIPAAALLRSFSCAPLCGVNASRRSAELASRRFPLPRGCFATGAVGRAGGRASSPTGAATAAVLFVLLGRRSGGSL